MTINLQPSTTQSQATGPATVRFSAFNQPGNFAGLTVAQVRAQYGARWEMPADAEVFKQGKVVVDENYVIATNDIITFIKRTGEKGSH